MNKIFFAIACAALLGGCGTPQPAPRLYELRAALPVTVPVVAMRNARDQTLGKPVLLLPAIQVNVRAGRWPPGSTGSSCTPR